MPEVEGEKTGVYESLINTFSADTLEELGQKLGLTDVDAFVKTVRALTSWPEKGIDEDMGKPAQFLKAIKQPPFYGIHRHIGLSTIIHGVNVNKDMQVLNAEGAPIEGLYAIGNCAGNFFGSPDYPMTVPGLSSAAATHPRLRRRPRCGQQVGRLSQQRCGPLPTFRTLPASPSQVHGAPSSAPSLFRPLFWPEGLR